MLVTWFLPMLLFLGGVASYEDIREGKIRNKWILLGLCYGTIVYVYLLIANPPLLNIHELLPVLINAFLALCMGFLLWHLGLWSAGDAKLFFVLAFLLPSLQPNDYVSFMGLLTYSFVPLFMFFVFFSLISGKSSLARGQLRAILSLRSLVTMLFFSLGASWLLGFFGDILIPRLQLLLKFLFLLSYPFLAKYLGKSLIFGLLIISILRLLLDRSLLTFSSLEELLLFLLLLVGMRLLLLDIHPVFIQRQVPVHELRNGMVPAEGVFRSGDRYFKTTNLRGLSKERLSTALFRFPSDGLAQGEISRIREVSKALSFRSLVVQRTLPFAPFLFIGAILTILSRSFL
ncbi:MAG TPA: prepilin peptidase [Candidatus Nanoarchaeia archaeon]|nr:prepilin peptidase [Candidatus Nanoarchaeia archaeon]